MQSMQTVRVMTHYYRSGDEAGPRGTKTSAHGYCNMRPHKVSSSEFAPTITVCLLWSAINCTHEGPALDRLRAVRLWPPRVSFLRLVDFIAFSS